MSNDGIETEKGVAFDFPCPGNKKNKGKKEHNPKIQTCLQNSTQHTLIYPSRKDRSSKKEGKPDQM